MTEEDHIIQRMSKEISIRDQRVNELEDEVFHLRIAMTSRDIEIKDLKEELRKRWERIEDLYKALEFYVDKANLERFIKEVYRYRPDDPDYAHMETSMMDEVTKVAERVLKGEKDDG